MARLSFLSCLTALTLLTGSVVAQAADIDPPARPHHKSSAAGHGGYSYNAGQTINTSGDARGRFGAADSLRDPNIDRQTNFGPFDHGFFYDTGAGAGQHGGNSPYLH